MGKYYPAVAESDPDADSEPDPIGFAFDSSGFPRGVARFAGNITNFDFCVSDGDSDSVAEVSM